MDNSTHPHAVKNDIAAKLLHWYDRHHRDLPWRVTPRQRESGLKADPYRVWLSEIMLQQTTVRAVMPYFAAFVERWPTVGDLAAADESDIMKAWAGLGYYSRARNLKTCADLVSACHGGRFPDTMQGLRALPGIGDYTAAAIAAIAFDRPAAVVDGNVERVLTRLRAIETPLPAGKREIRVLAEDLTPSRRPGDFAQAMMDLGATICTPKRPACALCPLNGDCAAFAAGEADRFPLKAPKKPKPVRKGAAFVAVGPKGEVFMRRRPNAGLLGGMSEVPTTAWSARADGETKATAGPFKAEWRRTGEIRHVFTHFELRLVVYRATVDETPQGASGWWSPRQAMMQEALPSVMKKAIESAIPDAFSKPTDNHRRRRVRP